MGCPSGCPSSYVAMCWRRGCWRFVRGLTVLLRAYERGVMGAHRFSARFSFDHPGLRVVGRFGPGVLATLFTPLFAPRLMIWPNWHLSK